MTHPRHATARSVRRTAPAPLPPHVIFPVRRAVPPISWPLQTRLRQPLNGGHRRQSLSRFRITEVILLSLRIGAYVFRGHQSGVVAEHLELATEMMRADAGLHTDQARWQVGEPGFYLAA